MATVYYADASAVVRAFLASESRHAELRELLAEGRHRVLTGELTRVEPVTVVTCDDRQADAAKANGLLVH